MTDTKGALGVFEALSKKIKPLIRELTRSAVRRKKMNIASIDTAAQTVTVYEAANPTDTITIPYRAESGVGQMAAGQSVQVEWIYDDLSTAVAAAPGKGWASLSDIKTALEITGGGGGDLSNYYTKPQTDALLAGKGNALKLLWTNSSPTSAFAAQTILNDGTLADYDLFAIKFKEQANSTGSSEFFFWYSKTSGTNLTTARWVSRTGTNIFFNTRSFGILDTGMTFSAGERNTQGSSSATTNNLYMVPWEVYGLKL